MNELLSIQIPTGRPLTPGGRWDLHTHTQFSDGEQTLEQVCALAFGTLSYLAVTDHDVLLSARTAQELSWQYGVEVIPGTELNTSYALGGKKVMPHLGLHWLPDDEPEVQKILNHNQSQPRKVYVCAMLEKLYRLGIDPSGEGVEASWQRIVDATPHSLYRGKRAVANLLRDTGFTSSRAEGMKKYLSRDGERLAFVPQEDLFHYADMEWVLDTVNRLNERLEHRILVTLNHPYYYCLEDAEMEQLVRDFARMGGHALEVHYPRHDAARLKTMYRLCDAYGLRVSGGSDRHDPDKPFLDEDPRIFQRLMDFHMRKEH